MTASVDMTADVKPRAFGVERSGAAGHSERGQYGHSQCSDGVADMRAQPSALLIWLASSGIMWLAWSLARDIQRMPRTGVSYAKYGPTVRRETRPGQFRFRVIANIVLLVLLAALGVAGIVSAGAGSEVRRMNAAPIRGGSCSPGLGWGSPGGRDVAARAGLRSVCSRRHRTPRLIRQR